MTHYRCLQCFHDFMSEAGPHNICPNCGFVYVKDMDANVTYDSPKKETPEKDNERTSQAILGDDLGMARDRTCDCA